jgi:arabinosaccharide transport system substrate-binding protein
MQTLSRRTFLKAAGGAAVASGLSGILATGCAPAVNTGAKKTLQFWAFTDTRIMWQQKAFELYKQLKKPDFDINWVIMPYQQMHDKVLITAQAGSGGPDIADIEISQFPRFIKGEALFVDLTPKLQESGQLDNFFRPSATDPWTWQGKIYGIGNELNASLLSYRWDLLEKAHVTVPFTTWDMFAEEAQRYHADTGKVLLEFPYNDWGYWWLMTLQQKGGFFDSAGRPTLDAPTSINTLTYQKKAITGGWSIQRPLGEAYYAALGLGEIAVVIGPSWNFIGFVQENLPDTSGKWHLQPMPVWEPGGSPTATQGGTGVSVSKLSPYAEEAVDFVIFEHTSVEALLNDFKIRGIWPTYKPTFTNPLLSSGLAFFDNQRVGELIGKVAPLINKWYTSPFWPETTDAFTRIALTPAIQDPSVSAQSACTAAQKQTLDIINFETA